MNACSSSGRRRDDAQAPNSECQNDYSYGSSLARRDNPRCGEAIACNDDDLGLSAAILEMASWVEERQVWRNGRGRPLPRLVVNDNAVVRTAKVYLATAHLDRDPSNSPGRNLKALCQRCHMIHDRPEHQRRCMITLRMRKAIGDLFLGLYHH